MTMTKFKMNDEKSPYAAAAHVPLIKSPSLRVPPRVELPEDIHPLPDSVTPYFVYPFTLEPHVLTLESSRRSTMAAHQARHEAYLRSREDEKEQRKREALRKIAPGFEPRGSVLVPTRATSVPLSAPPNNVSPSNGPNGIGGDHRHTNSRVMMGRSLEAGRYAPGSLYDKLYCTSRLYMCKRVDILKYWSEVRCVLSLRYV